MLGQVARPRATAALVLVGLLAHGTGLTTSVAHGRDLPATRPGPVPVTFRSPATSTASSAPLAERLSLQDWARPDTRPRPALALAMQVPTNAPGAPLTPVQPARDPGVFGKWWFWAAIGAV